MLNKFRYRVLMNTMNPHRRNHMRLVYARVLDRLGLKPRGDRPQSIRARARGMRRGADYNVSIDWVMRVPSPSERLVWTPRWGLRASANPIPFWREDWL